MILIDNLSLEIELNKAESLLSTDEKSIPENVKKIVNYCNKLGIGIILSRNKNNIKVGNCRDARTYRYRLGHIGIPLYDEFKSNVLSGINENGNKIIIAAHCRGHKKINYSAIQRCCELKYEPIKISDDDLKNKLNMEYGTVNPILIEINSKEPIIQVFDEMLFYPISEYPGTMITNAGELSWGMEFDPNILKEKLKNTIVGNIANEDEKKLRKYDLEKFAKPKSIGIITGNNPDSGMMLLEKINDHIKIKLSDRFSGDLSFPSVCLFSCRSMGLSMELDKRNSATKKAVLDAVETLLKLKNQKIDLIAIACHTTHYYTKEIREILNNSDIEFISMAESVIKYINKEQINNIAILGIDYVADLKKGYSAYNELIEIADQLPEKLFDDIRELGYKIKKIDKNRVFQKYSSLLKSDEIKSENILLAMTELSLIYEMHKKWNYEKIIIEPLDKYAEVIAEKSLGIYEN